MSTTCLAVRQTSWRVSPCSEFLSPSFDPLTLCGGLAGLAFYRYSACGAVLKGLSLGLDMFRTGALTSTLALFYGNLAALDLWHQKTSSAAEAIDLPTYEERLTSENMEV